MKSFVGVLGSFALITTLPCCALQSGAPESDGVADAEQVGAASEAATQPTPPQLTQPWVVRKASWSQGQPAVTLTSVATTFCVLTRLTGKFSGDGEWVQVYHDDTTWYLAGGSKQSGVGGDATCFSRSAVKTNGSTFTVSAEASAWARGVSGCDGWGTPVGNGNGITAITGLQGQMAGSGEFVLAGQATTTVGTNSVGAHSCATYLTGYAHSFLFDGSKMPLFMRPDGSTGDVNVVPAQSASGNGGSAILGLVANSFCYFSYIQGGFYGNGEAVQIADEQLSDGNHYWVLRTSRGGASSYVGANARCVARDQR